MLVVKNKLKGKLNLKQSLKGRVGIGKEYIYPVLTDLVVEPTKETQEFNSKEGYGNVIVNPIPDEYIIPDGMLDITENGTHDVTLFSRVSAAIYPTPTLQEKTIIPAKENQIVVADEGYDGLGQVNVNPIPDEYVVPSGELDIMENGSYDVSEYENVNVNVQAEASETPSVGVIINECDDSGYATNITILGITNIPNNYIGHTNSNYIKDVLGKKITDITIANEITDIGLASFANLTNLLNLKLSTSLQTIGNNGFRGCQVLELSELPETLTTIGTYAFYNCLKISLNKLPSNLTSIGSNSFYGCTNLKLKTIPDTITDIPQSVFYGCTGLTQISMRNVTRIYGSAANVSPFANCTGLKAVWIGSAVLDETFYQYSFSGCNNIIKIFIDLPRATVESFANYQYAFSDNAVTTDVIVCNDDEGFMTKEEFDAIDWSAA